MESESKIGQLPGAVRQQLARAGRSRKAATAVSVDAVLSTPGVMEDWVVYGVNWSDFPEMPEKAKTLEQMDWVVANFAAKNLDLRTAPSRQAITYLRECKRNPAFQAKYFSQHTTLRARLESEERVKRADDGRDLANTLRRLARIRAESRVLAEQERAAVRAAV